MSNSDLISKYPFLKIKDNSVYPWENNDDNYTWLNDIPQGWVHAFGESMCQELNEALGDFANQWEICQVKEKYGELVIYHNGCPNDIYNKVEDVIEKYSVLSTKTCACCGAPSTRFTHGWILPVCDTCFKKYEDN